MHVYININYTCKLDTYINGQQYLHKLAYVYKSSCTYPGKKFGEKNARCALIDGDS